MIVVWGRYNIRWPAGRGAVFCPICRGLECMRIKEIRSLPHLYFIPLSPGYPVGYETKCQTCGCKLGSEQLPVQKVSRSKTLDVLELAAETAPGFADRWAMRLEQEERVANGSLAPAERGPLLCEPFLALNYMCERDSQSDAGWLLIAVFLAAGAATTVAQLVIPGALSAGAPIFFGAAGLVLAASAAAVFRRGLRGWMRRCGEPLLIKALRPLAPTADELTQTVSQLRSRKLLIGKRTRVKRLARALESAGVDMAWNQVGFRKIAA
jgi:hypothetical protein